MQWCGKFGKEVLLEFLIVFGQKFYVAPDVFLGQ